MQTRHEWMDGLRGVAIVAVVLMHAELVVAESTGADGVRVLDVLNDALGPVRMPLLVLLSGLLVPRSLAKGWRHHLHGKLVNIAWPYLVWASLDVTHVLLDARFDARPVPWQLVAHLAHDPQTYLWFLAYLFAFHVLVTPLPEVARTVAGPACLVLGEQLIDPSAHRFVALMGWFLVGDALARLLGPRVPRQVAVVADRTRWGMLAVIGRSSLVYYVCHLLVMLYAVRAAAGHMNAAGLVVVAIGAPLLSGAALVHARRHAWVDALFRWPAKGPAGDRRTRPSSSRAARG